MFQSTHSLRSATADKIIITEDGEVSIHALLAECDKFRQDGRAGKSGFNPRTPCGVRHELPLQYRVELLFQSTHSLRSATYVFPFIAWFAGLFQSTHSLRSATGHAQFNDTVRVVSIHALLAECD